MTASMKIRAAVLNAVNTPFVIEELELDPPSRGEVLVRIAACGVCHSDWHIATGDTAHALPVITGHEAAGTIEQVGENVDDLAVGDRVVLNWAPACGRCFYCLHNKPNLCATFTKTIWAGTMRDGTTRLSRTRDGQREPIYSYCGTAGFATHTVVARESCVKISPTLDVKLEVAALVGCAIATGAGAAIHTAHVQPGDTVLVFGCGGVGLSIIQGAKLCGAREVIAVDQLPTKISVGLHFGATRVVMANDDIASVVAEHTDGRGADHVFEAIGSPAVQSRAIRFVRPGGTLTLVGLAPVGSASTFNTASIARKEITVRGSYYGSVSPQRDFPILLDLIAAGRINVADMITRRYSLDQINEAFADMRDGKTIRGLIDFTT